MLADGDDDDDVDVLRRSLKPLNGLVNPSRLGPYRYATDVNNEMTVDIPMAANDNVSLAPRQCGGLDDANAIVDVHDDKKR